MQKTFFAKQFIFGIKRIWKSLENVPEYYVFMYTYMNTYVSIFWYLNLNVATEILFKNVF